MKEKRAWDQGLKNNFKATRGGWLSLQRDQAKETTKHKGPKVGTNLNGQEKERADMTREREK